MIYFTILDCVAAFSNVVLPKVDKSILHLNINFITSIMLYNLKKKKEEKKGTSLYI